MFVLFSAHISQWLGSSDCGRPNLPQLFPPAADILLEVTVSLLWGSFQWGKTDHCGEALLGLSAQVASGQNETGFVHLLCLEKKPREEQW